MTKVKKREGNPLQSLRARILPFHIEMDACPEGVSLFAADVVKINESSECSVNLALRGMVLIISGEVLCMTVYENKAVEIVGRVRRVEYEYTKD